MAVNKSPFYVPTKNPESWKAFLAEPEKQWKPGYSAHALAHAWEGAKGFPKSFSAALKSANLALEPVFAFPEFQVELDTGKAPSQNDLFVVARDKNRLYAIAVEGKVDEPFGDEIGKWNKDQSPTRTNRLNFLLDKLELSGASEDFILHRYQLFHRTASAILMAEKLHAKAAMMVVHSYSQGNNHFDDYSSFAKIFDAQITPAPEKIHKLKTLSSGIDLYLGWVKG